MKAQISELFETGIQIITLEDEFTCIGSIADLKKCENVLVDKKEPGCPYTTILLDDTICCVSFRNITHPADGGRMRICTI